MAISTTPLAISADAQKAVIGYLSAALNLYNGSFNIRDQLLARDRAYYREQDLTEEHTKARTANTNGDPRKLQNITVPVVMPQVESALATLSDTFLTGYPIFGVVGPPGQEDAIGAMETLIGENSITAGWPAQLMQTMRNGLKYDLGAIEVVWEKKKVFNITTPELTELSKGKTEETLYEGNFMYDRSPYNLILDTRVSPELNHLQGEYAGYTELLSRIETKKRMSELEPLGTMNFRAAWESGTPASGAGSNPTGAFYLPEVNPGALLTASQRMDFNWMSWAGLQAGSGPNPIAYKSSYEWTVFYARIIPKELGIHTASASQIQIWKFIIINRSTVVFAERQTNAHNYLPIIVCKPSNDGMSYQSKSLADNGTAAQQVASALINSGLESQRRKVYDRLLYDPTKVRKQDIENTDPVARIPVRNSAFGKGIAESVHPLPYRDDGVVETMQFSQQIIAMGDIAAGQNRVQQGQFQKGNKTRDEFNTTMDNSNSRQKMIAIALEYSFFTPIKTIIKCNILQYQPPVSLLNSQSKEQVEVDPAVLRAAMLKFTLSDGMLPSEKLIDTSMFQVLLQSAQAIPALQAEYDFMGMFAYMMSIKGAHWVRDFKRTPEQQQQQVALMQQAGRATGNTEPPQPPQPGQPDAGAQGAT